MKANDSIPKDEMKLARMIAATHAKGLKWCAGAPFKKTRDDLLYITYEPEEATHVCAIGAMYLAGAITLKTALRAKSEYLEGHPCPECGAVLTRDGNCEPCNDKWTAEHPPSPHLKVLFHDDVCTCQPCIDNLDDSALQGKQE